MNYASNAGYKEKSFTVTTPTVRPACPSFTAKLYPKGSVKVGVLSLTSLICTRRLPVVACKNKKDMIWTILVLLPVPSILLHFRPCQNPVRNGFDSMRNGAVAKLFYT